MKIKTWLAIVAGLTGFLTATAVRSDVGAYAAYWDTSSIGDSIGGGLVVSLNVTPGLRAEGRIAYIHNFDAHHQDISVVPLELALTQHVHAGERFDFRVGAGVGYYFVDGGFIWPSASLEPDAENDVGYFVLAGVETVLTPDLSLFAEGQYRFLSFDKAKAVGDHLHTLKMDGFGALLGLRYRW